MEAKALRIEPYNVDESTSEGWNECVWVIAGKPVVVHIGYLAAQVVKLASVYTSLLGLDLPPQPNP